MQVRIACYVGAQLVTGLVTLGSGGRQRRVSDLFNDLTLRGVILEESVVVSLLDRDGVPSPVGTVRLLKSNVHLVVPPNVTMPAALRPAYVQKRPVFTRLTCGPYELEGTLHYDRQESVDLRTLFAEGFNPFTPVTDATIRFVLDPGWQTSSSAVLVNRDAVIWAAFQSG